MHNVGTLKKLVAGGLLSAGAVAGLGLAAGTADAKPFYWCPGDPPIMGAVQDASGNTKMTPIYPNWDTSVCHDYGTSGDHVREGKAWSSRSFNGFSVRPARSHGRTCRRSRTRVSEQRVDGIVTWTH